MKKTLALIVAFVMVFASVAVFCASADDEYLNREFSIYEIDTPPVIDGVINDGEYHLVSFWPADIEMTAVGDYVDNIEAYLYMCYDENNLYYAIKTECDAPHVAMMDNANNHFIFNAHHVMTLIVPDDPTKDVYPYEADKCGWADLYNGNFGFEWSMIFSSEEVAGVHGANESFATAHFIGVPSTDYKCGSADGWDCYEMAIPWSALKNNYNPDGLTGATGEVFGFDFNIGLSDINNDPDVIANGGYDNGAFGSKGNYLKFAGCYGSESGAKEIGHCAVITLGGEYVPEVDPVTPDESSEEEPIDGPVYPVEKGENVASGKSYETENFNVREDNFGDADKSKLTDGIIDTEGGSANVAAWNATADSASIILDLGKSTAIAAIATDLQGGNWGIPNPSTYSVSFAISTDGQTYEDLGTVKGANAAVIKASAGENTWEIVNFECACANATTARYIKVTYNKPEGYTGEHVWPSEIQVFDVAPVEEPSAPAEESKEESKPAEESKAPTPKTGDAGMIALAIVSVITLAGVVIVKHK